MEGIMNTTRSLNPLSLTECRNKMHNAGHYTDHAISNYPDMTKQALIDTAEEVLASLKSTQPGIDSTPTGDCRADIEVAVIENHRDAHARIVRTRGVQDIPNGTKLYMKSAHTARPSLQAPTRQDVATEGQVERVAAAIKQAMQKAKATDGVSSADWSHVFLDSWFTKAAKDVLAALSTGGDHDPELEQLKHEMRKSMYGTKRLEPVSMDLVNPSEISGVDDLALSAGYVEVQEHVAFGLYRSCVRAYEGKREPVTVSLGAVVKAVVRADLKMGKVGGGKSRNATDVYVRIARAALEAAGVPHDGD